MEIAQYKSLTLTQGGADVFVEGSIATDIVPEDGAAWEILRVEMVLDIDALAGMSADAWMNWSMSRDTKTAVVGYNDPDIVWYDGFALSLTTSGQVRLPGTYLWLPPEGTVFVEPDIYFQFDSNATGTTCVSYVRIYYRLVKVTEIQILRLLNSA